MSFAAIAAGLGHAESNNDPNARGQVGSNIRSAARGKYQLTATTAEGLVRNFPSALRRYMGMSGEEILDALEGDEGQQELFQRALYKDQQNTIRAYGGDPDDPTAHALLHRWGGKTAKAYINGTLDYDAVPGNDKTHNETPRDYLKRFNRGYENMSQQPAQMPPDGGYPNQPNAFGTGAQHPSQHAGQPEMLPPDGGYGGQPQAFGGGPGAGSSAPGTSGYSWGAGGGANLGPAAAGLGGSFGDQTAELQELERMRQELEMLRAQQSGNPHAPQLPPDPTGTPPLGGGRPRVGGWRRFMNAMLPGQPFNPDGASMKDGIMNTFTAGERGDNVGQRRMKRVTKALRKAKKAESRGNTKRAQRKMRKASRLMNGEPTGLNRWLRENA